MPIWEEGDVRSAGMGGTGTSMTKQSEQIDLAKQFLAYAKLTKESNIRIWQDCNSIRFVGIYGMT